MRTIRNHSISTPFIKSATRSLLPLAGFVLALGAPQAHAQYRASIQGAVTDTSGAVVPGATLTLTDIGTNEKQVRTSNDQGFYSFNALPADKFSLVVTAKGFQKQVMDQLQVIPDQPNGVNVQLVIGTDSQTVTVNASTEATLDTETANNGRTITENEIQHMPVYQRDVTALIQLAPGVQADGSQGGGGGGFQSPGTQTGASSGGGGNLGGTSSIFATENGASANANGGQFETNGYTVDGISTVSAVWGGSTVITPSQDSVSSVKIITNAYDAENGRFSGALTQITSKSGTNDLHGSFFIQLNRPGLNAYQRWNGPGSVQAYDANGVKLTPEQRGLLRDPNRYNQLGGSIGGPLWKNRIFAFFNYEGQSSSTSVPGTGWYSTTQLAALAPANSLASKYLNLKGAGVINTGIIAAKCSDAGLTENVNCRTIPGQGLNIGSPLTNGLGKQDLGYVSASDPGVGNGLTNVADIADYATSNPSTNDFKQYNGRLDADVTAKDHASFTIYWVPATTTQYNGGLGYQLLNHSQINDAFSVIYNHIFSPTLLNEARANAAGFRYNELQGNAQAPFGLPQDAVTQIGSITLANFGVSSPAHLDQWTYGYKDVATKVLATQTMKFGFDFTHLEYLNDPIGAPNYSFYNLWDFVNDAPEAEGGPFQATTGLPGGYRNDNRENMLGVFFQDDWKARPNLTISAGLRYNYFGPLTDKDNHMGTLTFGTGASYLSGITIKTGKPAWVAQKLNFGPQVGFNWLPMRSNGKIVIRGGYGLDYNQQQIATANAYDNNPPGTSSVPGTSNGPKDINPNIIYATSGDINNINGYPANRSTLVSFNAAGLPTAGAANLNGLPGHMPTEYSHHYSLDMEWDLGHSVVFNIGYEGSSSHHLLYNYDATALAAIYGYPQTPLVNSVSTFGSQGKSNNNMLLAGLKHEFSHTFSAEAQYTWAHSLDTDSGPYSRDAYLYNPSLSYGRSDYDLNSSFKAFGIWQPVFFHGSHAWAEKVAGGWSLSGIFNFHTGFGWTPVYQNSHPIYVNNSTYQYANFRPIYKGGGGLSTSNEAFKTGNNYLNPGTANTDGANQDAFNNNYFEIPNYANAIVGAGQAPTAFIPPPGLGRNTFSGPKYRDVDLTLAKSFGLPNMKILGEHSSIELKANALNIFNLLNIDPSTISTNIANANLGQATGALGSRTIDVQARFSF